MYVCTAADAMLPGCHLDKKRLGTQQTAQQTAIQIWLSAGAQSS